MSLPALRFSYTVHIGRIECFIIEHSQPVLQHFQKTLLALTQEAALLKKLEITQELAFPSNVFRLSTPIVHQLPSLKTLWLANIDFDWILFPLHSLTSLSLVCSELSKNPSWTEFYSVLRQMPSLEDLSFAFDDLRLTLPLPPHQGIEPLQLPFLQRLVINDSCASVIRSFLSDASFPRLQNTYLGCSFSKTSDLEDYSTTIDAVLRLMIKGSFGCLDQLNLAKNSFGLYRQADQAKQWAARRAIDFTAPSSPNSSSMGAPRVLMVALAALPINLASQVARLNLSVDLTSQQLLELFGHLPQLESITGKNISSRAIIKSLKISSLHPAEVLIPFPRVTSIELYGEPHENDYTSELLDELCNCLKERHISGAGLSQLSLFWNLTQEEVQRLQEYVADVEWGDSDENQDDDDISEADWDD